MAKQIRFTDVCPEGRQLHVKETVLDGSYRTHSHTHDFWEFFFVTFGAMRLHVNGLTLEMAAGSLCLAEPQDEHCFQNQPGVDRSRFTNVAVPAEVIEGVWSLAPVAPRRAEEQVPLTMSPVPEELVRLVARAESLLNGAVALDHAGQRMLAISLVCSLLAEFSIAARSEAGGRSAPSWLLLAMREMEKRDNYLAGLPVFLRCSGKSQEHVTRTLKKHYGLTPTGFINQIRLREAARLLRDTSARVQSIALEAGFGNISHFLALFRRRFGCSPREYRRQQRLVVDPVRDL